MQEKHMWNQSTLTMAQLQQLMLLLVPPVFDKLCLIRKRLIQLKFQRLKLNES